MRPTLRLVALAAGAGLQSSLGAEHGGRLARASVPGMCTRTSGRRRKLPPRLEEDIRLVGALAELFAAAAAERLMEASATRDASRPTLPLIALAAGAALCAPLLQQRATRRPARGSNTGQRLAGPRTAARSGPRAASGPGAS